MSEVEHFSYNSVKNSLGEVALRPIAPVTLSYQDISLQASGLLDTGADVNVLPYNLGIALGAVWEEARTGLKLSGNLANYEARGVLITATVGRLAPVYLAFAWTRAQSMCRLF